jgi:hypothetical protein
MLFADLGISVLDHRSRDRSSCPTANASDDAPAAIGKRQPIGILTGWNGLPSGSSGRSRAHDPSDGQSPASAVMASVEEATAGRLKIEPSGRDASNASGRFRTGT